MEPLGLDFGPPGEVNTLIFAATVVKNQGFRGFLKGFKKIPKRLQKETPGGRKCPPGAPRERPGAAQEAPRQGQERPGATQERPESRPRGEQKEQERHQLSILLVGWPREPPGGHLGATLERFWSLRGCIVEPVSRDFSLFEVIRCDRPRERRSKRSPSSKR